MRSLQLSFAALALAMIALLTACGGKAADKLIGKWTIDVDKMGEMEDIKKLPEDQKKAAMEMAKGMASSMTFEFTKDKILLDAMGQKKEGPYTVKSEAGDKVVIEGNGRQDRDHERRVQGRRHDHGQRQADVPAQA
jgi:hypothetical protein